jgi:hypothetical protein
LLFAAVAAVILHAAVSVSTLPHHTAAYAAHASWSGPIALAASCDTIGLWLPFAAIPWARAYHRTAAVLYVLGAAWFAAIPFYLPFDIVWVNGQRVPQSPGYGLALIVGIPLAGLGMLVGAIRGRFRRTAAA